MAKKKVFGGPRCPSCGGVPYDIIRWERDVKGPPVKKLVWYCPSVVCNPSGVIRSDEEVWG